MPHKIAAIILAAGRSERMGLENKLLAEIAGKPMLAHVVENVLASGADPVVVVTGHEAEKVEKALLNQNLNFVDNPQYMNGLSTSLKVGLAALPDDVDACLICLGDMPLVTGGILNVETDPVQAVDSILAHIEANRKKLGI